MAYLRKEQPNEKTAALMDQLGYEQLASESFTLSFVNRNLARRAKMIKDALVESAKGADVAKGISLSIPPDRLSEISFPSHEQPETLQDFLNIICDQQFRKCREEFMRNPFGLDL